MWHPFRYAYKWIAGPKHYGLDPSLLRWGDSLAKHLGVEIPPGIDMRVWSLPILEAIVERLDELEKKYENDQTGGDSPR